MAAWIDERLSLLETSASLFGTENCFVLFGRIPSDEVAGLRRALEEAHEPQVVVEEKELLRQDLERVPVMLRNPAYFRPFELMVRLLPLPRYTSCDPTPFIGIFFPLFLGMILGDVAYGVVPLLLALGLQALIREFLASVRDFVRSRDAVRDRYRRAVEELHLTVGHEGRAFVETLAATCERDVGAEVQERNLMGVRYHELTV